MARSRGRRGRARPPQPPPLSPPASPPKKTFQRIVARFRLLFAPRRFPAWILFLLAVINKIPDVDFWVRTAGAQGGMAMSWVAALLQAPLFSPALAGSGVLYLLFVGEPKRAIRNPGLQVIGWSVSGICLLVLIVTASIGFGIQAQTHFSPWVLTDDQQTRLGTLLDQQSEKFRTPINPLVGSTQSQTYALSLFSVFLQHGWPAVRLIDARLNPGIVGVEILVPWDVFHSPLRPHAALMQKMLGEVGIETKVGASNHGSMEPGLSPDAFWIVTGNRP
jgi:hypothetical protein